MLEVGRKVKITDTSSVQFTEDCSENKKERFYKDYEKYEWKIQFMNPGEIEPRGLVLVNEERLYVSLMSDCVRPYKKVYLSGPITGYENGNIELFQKYEDNLISLGFDVVNPHKLGVQEKHTHQQAMLIDLRAMLNLCDAVAFMPDRGADGEYLWISSRGCKGEMYNAELTGLEIINAETGEISKEFFFFVDVKKHTGEEYEH